MMLDFTQHIIGKLDINMNKFDKNEFRNDYTVCITP